MGQPKPELPLPTGPYPFLVRSDKFAGYGIETYFLGFFPNQVVPADVPFNRLDWVIPSVIAGVTPVPSWINADKPRPSYTPGVVRQPVLDGSGNITRYEWLLVPPAASQLKPPSIENAGKPYKYRKIRVTPIIASSVGPFGGSTRTQEGEDFWSDQSPKDLGWFPGKKIVNPVAALTTEANTTPITGGQGAARAKRPSVFNLPVNRFTLDSNWLEPYSSAISAAEAADRLVTITQPDYMYNVLDADKGRFTTPWGFRALMNPSTWGHDSSFDESQPTVSQSIMAQTDPATPGTVVYGLELMIYRQVDLAMLSVERQRLERKGDALTDAYASGLVQQWYGEGTWSSPAWGGRSNRRRENPLLELEKYGTEYDIEFLYRVVGGDPVKVVPGSAKGGQGGRWTSNMSILPSSKVRVNIGRADVFEGRINSISVKHLMMTKTMVPTVTYLTLSIVRYPGFAKAPTKPRTKGKGKRK